LASGDDCAATHVCPARRGWHHHACAAAEAPGFTIMIWHVE